jgi:CO/xanthine dehydrogenase Mo-binding subunit
MEETTVATTQPGGFSRRDFLKVGVAAAGGLVVGLSLPGTGIVATQADARPFAPNAFVRIARDGTVTLVMHKVEMGQGTYTSMSMLLAEELEVDLSRVRLEHAPPDDALYAEPLLGVQETGASTSVRGNWEPLRRAGATARSMLVAAAAQAWNVEPHSCHGKRQRDSCCHQPQPDLRRTGGPRSATSRSSPGRAEGSAAIQTDRQAGEASRHSRQVDGTGSSASTCCPA